MDRKQQILVCDDSEDIVELVEQFLRGEGFDVATANGGEAFWAALDRTRFDLIVLDIMMPGQDGFSIAQALRGKGDVTPIVFMTGHKTLAYRLQGPLLPRCDYMIKPFDPEMMLEKIRHFLNSSSRPAGAV
jgi:DNA-binding response OmpR family regulator